MKAVRQATACLGRKGGRDGDGRLAGLLHLAVCPASGTLSLSSMPRRPGLPNGFTSFLVVAAVSWCAERGVSRVSLNFAPLVPPPGRSGSAAAAARRRLIAALKAALGLQLDSLHLFNLQFGPQFRPRYVGIEAWTSLPRVALAAMAAEGYLPFAGRVRRRAAAERGEPGGGSPGEVATGGGASGGIGGSPSGGAAPVRDAGA